VAKGTADLIFEEIKNENDIQNLFTSYETESLHFDFKDATSQPSDDFINGLGKALSGFSNADGGVLIYGVNENKKVAPRFTLLPSEHFLAYQAKIQEMVSRLTYPPNTKVLTKTIQSTANNGKGYVLALIPKSDIAPHQDVKTQKYYQRAGDSHTVMHHYQISDLFGKRLAPELVLYGVLKKDLNRQNFITIELFVKNIGRAIAKFPFVHIHSTGVFRKETHYTLWFNDPVHSRTDNFFATNADKVIHSEVGVPLMKYFVSLQNCPDEFTEFKGLIGADGMPSRNFNFRIASDHIGNRLANGAPPEFTVHEFIN